MKKMCVIGIILCLLVLTSFFAFKYINNKEKKQDNKVDENGYKIIKDLDYSFSYTISDSLGGEYNIECNFGINEEHEYENIIFVLEFYNDSNEIIDSKLYNENDKKIINYEVVINKGVIKRNELINLKSKENIRYIKVKEIKVK